jgi:hypothetical protein
MTLDNLPDMDDKKPKKTQKEKEKEEKDLEELGKEFTGEGFMSYDSLVSVIKAYQQRQFCEDVDVIKKIGGELLFRISLF